MINDIGGEVGDGQSGDGYGCQCGFIADTLKKFRGHLWSQGRKEPGTHKSIGRVNLETGEVTLPPYVERTPEQIALTKHGKKKEKGEIPESTISRGTDVLANASQVRFVPRIYTVDYTPIMRGGQEASHRVFGWRPDMPLVNFLDTIIYLFFLEHGVTLGAYFVDEEIKKEEIPSGS